MVLTLSCHPPKHAAKSTNKKYIIHKYTVHNTYKIIHIQIAILDSSSFSQTQATCRFQVCGWRLQFLPNGQRHGHCPMQHHEYIMMKLAASSNWKTVSKGCRGFLGLWKKVHALDVKTRQRAQSQDGKHLSHYWTVIQFECDLSARSSTQPAGLGMSSSMVKTSWFRSSLLPPVLSVPRHQNVSQFRSLYIDQIHAVWMFE